MTNFLAGAVSMGLFVAGLFFLRFWKSSRDRFFLFFAISFWIEAVNRALITYASTEYSHPEQIPILYIIRLVAFGLILYAIYDKNRPKHSSETSLR